jgi:XTP/dITP diphosphohydrolase
VPLPELERLVSVMARLRQECPWDAQQTHRSLVQYLIEETAETVEAIELADQDHLREELGDLLLQVIFHAEIASEQARGFDVEEVARGIADKLISRHPYVFATAEVPVDLHYTWEQRKAAEKARTSALQGILSSSPPSPGPTRSSARPDPGAWSSCYPTSRRQRRRWVPRS